MLGKVLLPGTAFLELALHAAERLDCELVEELTLAAPLVLDEQAAVQLQVRVGAADEHGRRELSMFSQPERSTGGWVRHAWGALASAATDGEGPQLAFASEWPPVATSALESEALYDRFAEAGYEYGPAFQALRAVFTAGGDVYAEAGLDDDLAAAAGEFRLHPALSDAALQSSVALSGLDTLNGKPKVPFSFSGVRLYRPGVSSLRVLVREVDGGFRVLAVDAAGAAVLSIDSVQSRAIDPAQLGAGSQVHHDGLFAVRWRELPLPEGGPADAAFVGEADAPIEGDRFSDLSALEAAIADGRRAPEVVLVDVSPTVEGGLAQAAHLVTEQTLELLQAWLASESLADSRLVLLTRRALAVSEREQPDLRQATLPGLVRTAHSEHPDRFALVDVDGSDASRVALSRALLSDEPDVALREGALYVPRVVRSSEDAGLVPPEGERAWRLTIDSPGTLDSLTLAPNPAAQAPLRPGQVRVAVRAAGLNFKDVVIALGLVDGPEWGVGVEGAGVVSEVGAGVADLAVGDRVMGVIPGAFGPVAVADHRSLSRIPDGWSFVHAASVPIVFMTAYHGLIDLAQLKRGDRLLVHGAAGGVGMAAVQLARHLGVEVFATAQPGKWETLRAMGIDDAHIASSRDLEFTSKFRAATGGQGMDVVLGSLAGEMVDASLGLLADGGRYMEMGKTDVRDPALMASQRPGVTYHAFDLEDAGAKRLGEILDSVLKLFEQGVLGHLPITSWDVRRGREAFRFLRESKHTGKNVLRIPQPLYPNGTVLITGGTSGLGMLEARQLAVRHGVRHLLLVSRRGAEADGAKELAAELSELGCEVQIAACDVSDRRQLARLIDAIDPERPLTAVVHAAGVLDDGVITSLDGERLRRVMIPKLDAALYLHELTKDLEISEFILYSSAAAALGAPGQGNYAAANSFLDALAQWRRSNGLPATSLAFGLWERATGMTGHLSETATVNAGAIGLMPLEDRHGLELIDVARALDEPLLLPIRLDVAALRARARGGALPAIFSDLVQVSTRRASASGSSLARLLGGAPESERDEIALGLVRTHTAAVLGHGSPEAVESDRPFKELGFDSLSAVELRNRLAQATGVKLPATLVFDHPSPVAVARLLRGLVEGGQRGVREPVRGVARVDEPLAIVGMACRYPGGASSPEEFWRLLESGRDAIGEFPVDRGWDVERLYDPDPDHPGTTYTRQGGFLYDAAGFDAEHFSIAPREALAMDPQQRLLLETAWEALEHAGIDPLSLRGSETGTFVGVTHLEYGVRLDQADVSQGYGITGATSSVASGRVAYALGLEGPAVSVDTACSSSLVAMHLAGQALRDGECSLALAGGVAVIGGPGVFTEFARQRGLSPDGRCRAFGAGANGTGFSDGVGLLVLERLSDARRNGHQVLAVVRGSALNQDGASNGLTAPNGPSQERVIRRALAVAGVEPGDVDVVEAHGTGTTLGDPIEAGALLATYGQGRSSGPLYLGSVKSNIGHSQSAAGVAGVIKMVLAMRHGLLPRTLYAEEPSPHVDWEAGTIKLLTEPVEWPAGERPRRAGVSSFGISGTNAHVILEEAPAPESAVGVVARAPALDGGRVMPFLVSGSSDAALRAQARRLREFVQQRSGADLEGVAASLAFQRSALVHRAVALAEGRDELVRLLAALERGDPADGLVEGVARGAGRVALVFPGQGSQWQGMGWGLWQSSPVFAREMEACSEALARYVDWSLEDVLRGAPGAPSLDRVDVVQPALFAVMVSLAGLWRSFGIEPAAVVGHSQGEIAAAYVAGALSLDDAARVVALRSMLVGDELSGRGGMLSVGQDAERVRARLEAFGERVSLAAVNGPSSVVVSGELQALREVLAGCESDGVRAKLIPVDYAAHSVQIEAVRERMLAELSSLTPRPPEIPFYSTVTGELLDGVALDGDYWYRNLRETVQFEQAVRAVSQTAGAFIEASPHPVLTMAAEETIEATGRETGSIAAIGSLRRDDGGPDRFLTSLAEAHARGVHIDWDALLERHAAAGAELPTYAFQHRHYWLTPAPQTGDVTAAGLDSPDHPLLGAALRLAGDAGWVFTGRLSLETQPWLADHAVLGTTLLPGTGFVELALAAGTHVGCGQLEDLVIAQSLLLPTQEAVHLQVSVSGADERGRRQITIHSSAAAAAAGGEADPSAEEWIEHASGTVAPVEDSVSAAVADLAEELWPPEGAEPVEVEYLYDQLAEAGFDYGPAFQGLERAWRRGDEIFAEVGLAEAEAAEADGFGVHPALLDAALHSLFMRLGDGELPLPFSWKGVRLYRAGAPSLRVRLQLADDGAARLSAVDGEGVPVLSLESLVLRPAQGNLRKGAGGEGLLALDWVAVEPGSAHLAGTLALIGTGRGELELGQAGQFGDLAELAAALDAGAPKPEVVFVDAPTPPAQGVADEARRALEAVLEIMQEWLVDERFSESRLVVLTRGAVAAGPGETPDLSVAPLWGLLRSAQSEHPDRFALIDVDGSTESWATLPRAVSIGEPQLALRAGGIYAPRLVRSDDVKSLVPPADEPTWHLDVEPTGTLENLKLLANESAGRPLARGEVRVAVHAAGLNFRDVLVALDMYPGQASMGIEGAGVVIETGPGIEGLRVGDRVMGLIPDAFGPMAVTDGRCLVPFPDDWSFAEAASLPTVFLTAHYGLTELAQVRPGEKVLIHAAAGGVGMAAVQLARHLGAEVFATAHPSKWGTLRGLGLDEDHIASSRDLEFKDKFLAATDGRGMAVVLDALAREFVDASLELLPEGGRFIEMGKTDIRDPKLVASRCPGVAYRAFDLYEAGPDRLHEMLTELVGLFEGGALQHLPITSWDVREAPEAIRYLRDARHVGKVVLTISQPLDRARTVLITGGTGELGGLVARHLAATHGVRHLLLVSRRGPEADGADALVAELQELGCEVRVAACDVADRGQLKRLLDTISAMHPLGAVVHTAGVLDDATIQTLTPEKLESVLRPKVDAALNLHELTRHLGLSDFILYSSAAAALGAPGQGNYAAANTFLEALAAHRCRQGLPARALAWGLWRQTSGLTAGLSDADHARMRRHGLGPLDTEQGLELFDAARELPAVVVLPLQLDRAALRTQARAGTLPVLFAGLVQEGARRQRTGEGTFAGHLGGLPESEARDALLKLIRAEATSVLGHASDETVRPEAPFKELGFDSLSSVELRNRLVKRTALKLPATLLFDHPTPLAVVEYLLGQITGAPTRAVIAPAMRSLDEPLAIVGMACRYPGGASSPEEFWRLLASGQDAIGEFPTDRGWDLEQLYDPDPDQPGTTYTRHGGFLYDAADFDAEHFSISPREALAMDPQQRLLLETAWEALEDAGIDPQTLRGTPTGVFAGVYDSGYGTGPRSPAELEGFRATGAGTSVTSGRLAYAFGLEGPAVSVDTACSSSLVAMHLAGQALRAGECSLALVGGVSVLASPLLFIEFARQRGLSPDGRCRAFGAGADGTGFSDGVGLLVLERLSDARRNGHAVLAVVRGSAVNQDGASNGLTAPNGPSQERVIARALASAGLEAGDVDAVEAHGTGTTLGDPIEAQALLGTYGQGRSDGPLWLGSAKSNIGHTQAAAGVAGVIKMVMAMRHGVLPKTLHAEEPSPHVDWGSGKVALLSEAVEWPSRSGHPRRAGVSSFGISGTNAHVILEEAPAQERAEEPQDGGMLDIHPVAWLVSAKSDRALQAQAERLLEYLVDRPELSPRDVAFSLATSRARLERRAAVVAGEREQLLEGLADLARGGASLPRNTAARGKTAFMFTGQGAQRQGMGQQLYDAFPVFARAFDEACAAFEPHMERALAEVIFAPHGAPETGLLDRTEFTQPALFAIEVALFRLVESLGMRPDFLIGHSIGELVAAHVADALSLADACELVAARGRLMGSLPETGAMLAVQVSESEAREEIAGYEDEVSIAAVNGPRAVVISGDAATVGALRTRFEDKGWRNKRLRVSHAFHSPLMQPMLDEFATVVGGLTFNPLKLPIVSNLTGELLTEEQVRSAAYWVEHARGAVRFADGVAALERAGVSRFLELGPDGVLSALVRRCLSDDAARKSASAAALRTERSEPESFVEFLAAADAAGVEVDWRGLLHRSGTRRVPLPSYAFQRRRYWLTAAAGAPDAGSLGQTSDEHPLLRAMVPLGDDGAVFTGRLAPGVRPWQVDAVIDTAAVPGTVFLDLAIHAAAKMGSPVIEELTLRAPLSIDENQAVQLQLTVSAPDEQGRRRLSIYSRPETPPADGPPAEWTAHASGVLSSPAANGVAPGWDLTAGPAWPPEGAQELAPDDSYELVADRGVDVRAVWRGPDAVFAEAALAGNGSAPAHTFALHPALLDAALAPVGALPSMNANGRRAVPVAWKGVRLHHAGASSVRVRIDPAENTDGIAATVWDEAGTMIASMREVVFGEAPEVHGGSRRLDRDALFGIEWTAVSAEPETKTADAALLIPDGAASGGCLADAAVRLDTYRDLESLRAAADDRAPDVVFADFCGTAGGSDVDALTAHARPLLHQALGLVQEWTADARFGDSVLVFVTRRAIAARSEEGVPTLEAAPLWGLIRSAQAEHPHRFALLDLDGTTLPLDAVLSVLGSGEPQMAVRDGSVLAPRVTRLIADEPLAAPVVDGRGTVLITGGTGAVARHLARHLVLEHGVKHLVLTSRRGSSAPTASETERELNDLGAEVTVVACDVTDREQLTALLNSIPAEKPLVGVVHAAGVGDNATVASMTPDQIDEVLRPKLDGALLLDELTQSLGLSMFVLCSSFSGVVGGAGLGNYSAGNVFLDALAAERRARGRAATSLAWGLWTGTHPDRERNDGEHDRFLTRAMGSARYRGLAAEGMLPLFDKALASGEPLVMVVPIDRRVIAAEARDGTLPRLFAELAPAGASSPRGGVGRPLAQRVERVAGEERNRLVAESVRAQLSIALGYESPEALDMQLTFLELGLDSLVAEDFRRRLHSVTGLEVPAELMFEIETPADMVEHVQARMGSQHELPTDSAPSSTPDATPPNPDSNSLTALFVRAQALDRTHDGIALVQAAAAIRPVYDGHAGTDPAPHHRLIPLSRGGSPPRMFCFPSIAATGGPHEYVRFAKSFRDTREIIAVALPGFEPGEPLPGSLDAAIAAHADAIRAHTEDRRFILVGHSTGGLLAYAVAAQLVQAGAEPLVVLIDTYPTDTMAALFSAACRRMLEPEAGRPSLNDERLTAMGGYLRLLEQWDPGDAEAPTLLVKASEPLPELAANGDWQTTWSQCHATIAVQANHFTIIEDRAHLAADAVERWLASEPGRPRRGPAWPLRRRAAAGPR